jgi:serine O-acetyltransferase
MTPSLKSSLLYASQTTNPVGTLIRQAHSLINSTLELLFPIRSEKKLVSTSNIDEELTKLECTLITMLSALPALPASPSSISKDFITALEEIRSHLELDAEAMLKGDPAAHSADEVILCYPGFLSLGAYRLAHRLHQLSVPLLPRIITEYAHRETGIDIHPGAIIGSSCCIDHGTGLVIGETSIIGNNVRFYQGVTLGGMVVSKDMANKKRHPTIGNNVVIYANATILGGETIIGDNCIIGGSVWLTSSVAANSTVYHRAETIFKNSAEKLS